MYRVDGQRQDYGIHNDGTLAFIHQTGYACFVVAAVRGTTQSRDSNRYCIIPMAKPMLKQPPKNPIPTATPGV